MSYIMKTNLARKENYGGGRSTSAIKYIVFHFTANDGDSDESNGNYFKTHIIKASAHYFVDDDSVTQSVPDNHIAYSVGGNKYNDCSKTGGGKLYKIAKNANTINIELCDTKRDGVIMATEATLSNAVELCRTLMKKYNVDVNHVIRHFDVNGKHCPSYFMDDAAWSSFKKRLTGNMTINPSVSEEVSSYDVFKPYMVSCDRTDLNIRKGPGTNYPTNGKMTVGFYTIVAESSGKGANKGWGKLKSGAGWISLDFVTKR